MMELLSFIQKYLPIEAFLPLFFLIIILYIKYVYTPWNIKLNNIYDLTKDINELQKSKIKKLEDMLFDIQQALIEHKTYCNQSCLSHTTDIRKIVEKLNEIERNVNDVVTRLEKVKDDAKDGKLDLNQHLFSIKQEISDLRSKIEPLLFVSRGIK